MMFLGILEFFKNSNQNGFGFLTVVVLFYLFIFFLIQFFQHQKHFYLLYSLYALVNGTNLLKYIDGVFFSGFFETSAGSNFMKWSHYPAQLFGSLLFTYFVIEIMRLRKTYPRSIRAVDYYYSFVSPIYLVLWGIYVANPQSYLIAYFHVFFLIPAGYIVFFWILYMVYTQKMAIKWYILSGMVVLAISYLIISLFSLKDLAANNQTLYIFYIGILIESLLFALAIGLEQKMVYKAKASVQKKYIQQLEENQSIKESINRTLSEELLQTRAEIVDITAEAQRERTEKLTVKFENRFAQLRLDALRSQMNPHFIFNALNSIKSYFIENNQEKAIFYLTKFSKLIRNILESLQKDQISLDEELETLKMYVAIESDRFKNNIEFVVDVNPSIAIDKVMVPALFLQPFVENAIWHGLSTKKGKKRLYLQVEQHPEGKEISFVIEDNGVGRKETERRKRDNPFKKQSLGLTLTGDRLDLFSKKMGRPYQYTITDLVDKSTKRPLGTKVVIKIPKIEV